MAGGLHVLPIGEELFVEFLSRTDAGVDDTDIAVWLQTGQPDEVAGQVVDPDHFTHVQYEYLATCGHGPGLDDELYGFRDGHKVAFHIGVGDGDRAPFLYLFHEDGDHTAPAAQDVAETYGGEPGLTGTVQVLIISSATRLEAPITEEGLTALSVETRMKVSARQRSAARATLRVPMMLLVKASGGGAPSWVRVYRRRRGI